MNTLYRLMKIACVSCLLIMSVSWLMTAPQSQEADTSGLTAPAQTQTVKKPVHDRPIEHFSADKANVRSVLQQLAEYSGIDIVVDPKVSGNVSLTVTNKTWREIMTIVCKISNLTVIKESAYLYVVPVEDYRKQQLDEATASQAEQAVEDLRREVIKINNAQASEIEKAIQSLLSTRGKVTVVERNNALIIYDTEKNIAQIKKTIQDLDVETNQVFISCKIITVGSTVLQDLGIGWGYFDQIGSAQISATHMPNFSVAGELDRLVFGVLGQDKLAASLSFLFQNSKAEVVAQPQITTLDNKEADIFLGSQVPVLTVPPATASTSTQLISATPTVTMVDAGTELTVTPHVTSEKRIMLALNASKSSYTLTGTGSNPIIDRQSARTNVVVSDGETVVIAGLTSNDKQDLEEGIPFLKDIPVIGNLFKHHKKSNDKNDLIVFVTPHIIAKKVEAVSGVSSPALVK
ncbi:MAG TPA: secretin N-terminal domain-containing protein [Chitinivibrionales bacterium]|nr:secretin N-terminal domain-containing protein [Chitinivibrionales bacterium]